MELEFESVMLKKTDIELLQIITTYRKDYQPKAIEAVENEIKRRNLTTEKTQEIIDNVRIETEKERVESKENDERMFVGIDLEKLYKKKIIVLLYMILISEVFALIALFRNNLAFDYSYFLKFPIFSILGGFCLVCIPFMGNQLKINIFNSVSKKGLINIDKGLINIDFNYGLFLFFILGWLLASIILLFERNI